MRLLETHLHAPAAPPTDVDTTGSTGAIVAQVVVSAADAWIQTPHGQFKGGLAAVVALVLVLAPSLEKP
ncbi:MAG: hypothetical protein HUU21_23310 [Polyangiaceae bacterium]|nr:hypothetical protein [Polyangiaceae bacterium]